MSYTSSPQPLEYFEPRRPDYLLLASTIALLVLGTLMVYSASFVVAHNEFNDDAYFLVRQLMWIGVGGVGLLLAMRIDYRRWRLLSLPIMFACIGLLVLVRRLLPARGRITIDSTWACGYPAVTSRMQYTAASFAAPLLGMFGAASGIVIERKARTVHTRPVDLVLDRAARPLWDRLQLAAGRLRWMQSGRLHWYLLYVLATLAILLGYLAAGGIR